MKSDTVFGHLAHQFAVHPENLATEALAFILRTSPAASRAFLEFLCPTGLNCPGGLYLETQRGGLEQSIPDMKCRDDKGQLRVIVENKFWAGLTENQPVTYISELPAGVPGLVLFVVPQARLQLVWDEVVSRCIAAKIRVGGSQNLASMTFSDIGGGHVIAATSWKALLGALSTETTSAGELERRNDIAQLQGLCRRMDEEEMLPLRGDELTNLEMARRIVNFSELALEIVYKAERLGLCSRNRAVPYKYGSGTSVQIGEYRCWIGFDALSWRILGVSPFSVTFSPPAPIAEIREKLVRYRAATPQRCFDYVGGSVNVPILLKTGVEKPHIIDDAVCQIGELVKELGVQEPAAPVSNSTLTDDVDEGSLDDPGGEANE